MLHGDASERPALAAEAIAKRALRRATTVVLVVLAASLVLGAFAYRKWAVRPVETPPVLSHLEGFSLYDQSGKSVELADLDGTVWVADFIFTSCQVACPMLTSKMRTLQRYVEERERTVGHPLAIRLVSFSVDPEVDTPDKLAAYAAKWGADNQRWLFLTGPLAEVNRAVTRGLKIPFEKGGADTSAFDVMHGEHFVIVDGAHDIRGYFDTDPAGMTALKSTLDFLVSEKGH